MIRQLVGLFAAIAAVPATAQMPRYSMERIATPAEPAAIPLYPTKVEPSGPVPETWERVTGVFPDGTVTRDRMVRNVGTPSITPFLPDPAKATGAAVVVAPGGAFMSLSVDSEGAAVATWLADHGIAAFVLKYRLNPTPAENGAFMAAIGARMTAAIKGGAAPDVGEPRAYADALQALKLVRAGASRWHLDPAHVGIIGFSAGAMTPLQNVLVGASDDRPAFLGYIYGPMTSIAVPASPPPIFAALASDDPLFGHGGFGIIDAWRRAGGKTELHFFERGDHGFGTGRPGTTSTLVMEEFRRWLETDGFLGRPR